MIELLLRTDTRVILDGAGAPAQGRTSERGSVVTGEVSARGAGSSRVRSEPGAGALVAAGVHRREARTPHPDPLPRGERGAEWFGGSRVNRNPRSFDSAEDGWVSG